MSQFVSYDIKNKEILILMEQYDGVFHGHVRTWDELNQEQKNRLIQEFDFQPNGKGPKKG
jgi:hypothetical protein